MVEPTEGQFKTFRQADVVYQLEGGLNNIYIVKDDDDKKRVIRIPKNQSDRQKTREAIKEEYRKIGATAVGIDFRLRSMEEQSQFMGSLTGLGLDTLASNGLVGEEMTTEFMDGVLLSRYVRQDPSLIDSNVIQDVLTHLSKAHSIGVVFGDRWVNNTMVLVDGTHREFDFDIELIGEEDTIRAFELAQTLYHLIHFAESNRTLVSDMIVKIYTDNVWLLKNYDMSVVLGLLEGQRDVFYQDYEKTGTLYEGVAPPREEITNLMNQLYSIWQYKDQQPATNQIPIPKEALDV